MSSETMTRFAEEVEKCIRELAPTPSTASALMMVASAARAAANGAGEADPRDARDPRDERIKLLERCIGQLLCCTNAIQRGDSSPALSDRLAYETKDARLLLEAGL